MRMPHMRAGFSRMLLLSSPDKAVQKLFRTGYFEIARRTFAGGSVRRHCVMSAFHAELVRILSPE